MLILGATGTALTILLGLYLARRATAGKPPTLRWGLSHAGLGLVTVALLALAASSGATTRLANAALLLLVFALVGGLFILVFRLQRQSPPMFMVYLHAASALIAAVLLGLALR
jgi:hypothetical protein